MLALRIPRIMDNAYCERLLSLQDEAARACSMIKSTTDITKENINAVFVVSSHSSAMVF